MKFNTLYQYRLFLSAVIFLYLLTIYSAFSQIIPPPQSTNWNIAGLAPEPSNSPAFQTLAQASSDLSYDFVREGGGDNTGKHDNAGRLSQIFQEVTPPAVISFPSGIYLFKKPVHVPSGFIIRGTSPNTTHFLFDLSGKQANLFTVKGRGVLAESRVTNPYQLGDNTLEVEDGSLFGSLDDLELDQENDPTLHFYNTPWAQRSVGQMLQVGDIRGNKIFLDRTLTKDYNLDFDPVLRKVNMAKRVGFEAFAIKRIDNGLGSNFLFDYAADSWISCVHSSMATRYHVEVRRSRNCLIKGSFFNNAQFHCGGGSGYGVMLRKHTTECLIVNNIFTKLRHAMMVKEGVNRNVISYNYSDQVYISDGRVNDKRCTDLRKVDFPDISVHGHYSHMNLFEHNVVQAIHSADNWGPSGAGTTFFRNVVESDYGIRVGIQSTGQNIIGNVLGGGSILIDTMVTNTLSINNRIGRMLQNSGSTNTLPPSLYLDHKPGFYEELPWPSVDPFNQALTTNSAKERWKRHKIFDRHCCGDLPALNSEVTSLEGFTVYYEKQEIIVEYLPEKKFNLALMDTQGRVLQQVDEYTTNSPLYLDHPLKAGVYILSIYDPIKQVQVKLVAD